MATVQEQRIEAAASVEEANAFCATLAADVVSAACVDEWQAACGFVQKRVRGRCSSRSWQMLMGRASPKDTVGVSVDLHLKEFEAVEIRGYEKFLGTYGDISPVLERRRPAAERVDQPMAIAVAVAGVLWAAIRGLDASSGTHTRTVQQELLKHLRAVMRQVNEYFFVSDLAAGRLARVDEYFGAVEHAVADEVDQITAAQADHAREEEERLVADARLEQRERAENADRLRRLLREWEEIGERLERAAAGAAPSAATVGA